MTEQIQKTKTASTKINKVSCKGFKSFQRKTSVPFYEGLTAVVGENGSGKCVTGDTEVLLSDGSREKISNIVESAIENSCEEIDDGYISYEGDHKVLSINQETFEIEKREVLAYAKREAPNRIIEIETRSGRKITATKDHPLFILEDGELEAVDVEELSEGRRIAVPRETDINPEKTRFNEIIKHISAEDNLYVPYSKQFEEIIRKTKKKKSLTWKEFSEQTEVPYNAFKGIRDKQSCNLAYAVKILQYCQKEDEIPKLIDKATSKKSSKEFEIPWNNSHEFSRLLGYLLAEGKVTENDQIWFTNSNKKLIRNYEELFSSVFGIETDRKKYNDNCWDVLAYSSGVCTLLEKFGVSEEGSGEKKIPDLFLKNASKKHIGGLLEGLYAGDGYVSNSAIEITVKSPQLVDDIQQALLRLGVNSRIQEKEKTATSTGSTNTYYQLNITGAENIKKLKQNMNIPHNMKRERIEKLSKKISNTNIDLIEANGLVQKAVDKTSIKPHSRENRQELSVIGAYYSEKSLTSRKGIKQILEKYGDKDEESLTKLEELATSDIYWDEIVSIKEKKPESDWVYDLNVSVNHNFIANNTFVHNSNILDAISFVFGRRSSRLRAKKLEQLIYNGGDSGKPADHAHVTIHLDNKDGTFDEFLEDDEEAEEITVGRKVTRAGSSMYKFQGTNCKRSRIDEIARKANIDPSGYHFVRQGKVTEIVEQSGIERREVIDELSGITHFEEKKEEALEELNEVEETLKEQEIILNEKKEQLDKLEEEKELALKYRELEERKKKIEASILEVRKRALSNQLANINTDVSEQRNRIEEIENKLEELDNKIDEKQDRIDEIDEKQSESNTDIQHLDNKIEKKKGKIENKREKKKDLQETLESIKKMQQKSNTGSRAVDAVLSLDNPKIHGAFQDLISVDERYATAIETAAGGHMTDVVVENKNTALEAINYLKRENIGRARMLPLDKIKTSQRSAKSKIAKKKKGVIDYAAELVDYNSDFSRAIQYVFRDTLIAEDLDSVKSIDGVRVVTLDGDIMSKGGAMSGGKKKKRRSSKSSSKVSKRLDPDKKKEEIKEIDKEIESLQKDIAELKRMKEKREQNEETNQDLINEKKEIREELQDLREDRQDIYSEKQKLKTKIDQVGSKKANLKAELENVKEDEKDYDFHEDELIGLESTPEELKKKKKKILRKQNSMGPVNMRAIDEYKEKKEEYDEFKEKVSEIRQEKLEIEDMIEQIEQKKREKFMETLTQIQDSFSRIFEKLFGGGTGELVLEDDDINKGLDIKAQPPGKEPHIITALSGGEKTMTAIAFVFAILEYEESPFYIMDEIDAALDKSNSKKLSELLKDYADDSQFIVISHNDITVRHAERAYGISMRDGVSKVRSIDLDL